ncbi:hypothetical protein MKW98_003574 [Papaver atlanticum]|uniref:Cupin type-1 domain-containing protein n=1 Tax=Papaver atlanticum TaxID=357466 RepID=A0AAD4TC56_9MAGN|nr:hypothetical protein MKW98_003574 [Papaver atlanticum]
MAMMKIKSYTLILFSLISIFLLSATLSLCHHDHNLRQCRERCEQKQKYQQQRCLRDCQEKYGGTGWESTEEETERSDEHNSRWEEQQQQQNNPYFFDKESFNEWFRTQDGYFSVSQKFSEKSKLLRGFDNYRLSFFEANPRTFVVPSHIDAEYIFYVVKGKGTISLVNQESRETYNLERGDVLRVPAGTILNVINRDSEQKLQFAEFAQSISIPGRPRDYIGMGGQNPESFFNSFSGEVLEAAFNTPRDQLKRLFGQQKKGMMFQASEEQIKAISKHASESHQKRKGKSSGGPFNLLQKSPLHSNKHGKLFQIDGNDYNQLQDLDMSVTFTNITKGGMMAPFYNSKSSRFVMIVKGQGYFEMVCPHLSKTQQRGQRTQEQEETEQEAVHYQRISAQLRPKTAFIIPAGHPTTILASKNENLQMVVFGINVRDNQKNFLAGRENVMNQMSREAKELGFNVQAKEVEEIFNNQKESFFLPGPQQQQQKHDVPLNSIYDFAGF